MLFRPSNVVLASPSEHPLAQDLVFAGVSQYPGSIAYFDGTYCSNTGTVLSMVPEAQWQTCYGRSAFNFVGGSGDYIQLATPVSLANATPWTIDWWGQSLNAVLNNPRGWFGHDSSPGNRSGIAYDVSTNRLRVWLRSPTATNTIWTFTGIPPGSLDHFTMVCDGAGSASLYRNGSFFEKKTGIATTELTIARIGYAYNREAFGMCFDQLIWTRAISPADFLPLHDPSNVMLSGLLRDPVRITRVFFRSGTPPVTFAQPAIWMGVCV